MSEGNGIQGLRGAIVFSKLLLSDSLISTGYKVILFCGTSDTNCLQADRLITQLWATTLVVVGPVTSGKFGQLIKLAKDVGLDIERVKTPEELKRLLA